MENKIKSCLDCEYLDAKSEIDEKYNKPIVKLICKHRKTIIKNTDILNQIDINCKLN